MPLLAWIPRSEMLEPTTVAVLCTGLLAIALVQAVRKLAN